MPFSCRGLKTKMKYLNNYTGGTDFRVRDYSNEYELAMGTRHNDLKAMAKRLKKIRVNNEAIDQMSEMEEELKFLQKEIEKHKSNK